MKPETMKPRKRMKNMKLKIKGVIAISIAAFVCCFCAMETKAQSLGGGAMVQGNTNVFLLNPVNGAPTTNIYSLTIPSETLTVGNLTNASQIFSAGYGMAIISRINGIAVQTNFFFPLNFTNNCAVTGTNITGPNTLRTNFPPQTPQIEVYPAAYFNTGAATNNNTASINP